MADAGVAARRRRRRRGELVARRLILSGYSLAAASPEGTLVGNITNSIGTLTLVDNAGGRIKLVGTAVQAGSVSSNPGTYLINIKEENSMSSQITQIGIVVS